MGNIFRKYTVINILLISAATLRGQDIIITFAAAGESTTITTVKVENLTQGTNVTINGDDLLNLEDLVTGINSTRDNSKNGIAFSPNPMSDFSMMEFSLLKPGYARISFFDMAGREILLRNDNLSSGNHKYRISGIKAGMYIVRVISEEGSLTGRFISTSSLYRTARAEYVNSVSPAEKNYSSKGLSTVVPMKYNAGDIIKFTGISGNYKTIVVDSPNSSKTIIFNFYNCTDEDKNNYPVVQIGEQVWMAENLKTTRFNDGTPIPNIKDDQVWASTSWEADGYCWYNNDTTFKNLYGAMYTSWAAFGLVGYTPTERLCPAGWHIPDEYEWFEMISYLDPEAIISVASFSAGGPLKETGTNHWESPNTGATNETGFTALPGGFRGINGLFIGMGKFGSWWSDRGLAHYSVFYSSSDVRFSEGGNEYGRYVRCVKD